MTDNWKEYKKKQGKYFDKNSSSFHILSGDKKLNLFEKILWLIFNFINREISNILLVVLLVLCFYRLFKNKIVLDKYDKRIISYVVLFSLWIIIINYRLL